MHFIKMSKEISVADLAAQAYTVGGKGTAQAGQRAEAALRQANPQLADLKKVPRNAVIIVPEVAGLDRVPTSVSVATAGVELFERLERVLDDGRKHLVAAAQQASKDASATLALLKDREFSSAVKRTKQEELTALVGETRKNATAQVKQFEDAGKSIDRTILALRKDLKDMKAWFGS